MPNDFPQFKVNPIPLHWAVPTNQMGKSLWTYQVKPAVFPVAALNGLLSLSGFTNRLASSQELVLFDSNKTVVVYIQPATAMVGYVNHSAEAEVMRLGETNGLTHLATPMVDWPATNELEGEGLKLLEKFGITREDLSPNAGGAVPTFGRMVGRSFYNYNGNFRYYVNAGIIPNSFQFIRRLDGIDFQEIDLFNHGCYLEFNTQSQLTGLRLIWRNYQHDKCYRMAGREEIIRRIRDGKALLAKKNNEFLSAENLLSPKEVQSLTITGIIPAFIGEGDSESESLFPTARVEAIADLGTNQVGIELYCPILSTNRVK